MLVKPSVGDTKTLNDNNYFKAALHMNYIFDICFSSDLTKMILLTYDFP